MDYVYLTALVLGMSGFYCCHSTKSEGNNNYHYGISGTLVSLVIMILYTIFTKDEMGDIPFLCPANYPYTSHLIRTACQVRAANLLIMWISPAVAFLLVIVALIISFCCCSGRENNCIA
ncbi:unnamed protein product [Rhizophagus irregularis]|nr:unnamed protein product [Rhizophagus irregularis]CAB4412301.1 unnamed protein product [Rhizophagus irregularis]